MSFLKYNRHPQGLMVNDCVVRALSTAFNKDYLDTRRELNRVKKELGYKRYVDHYFICDYLSRYEKISFKAVSGEPRMKLSEFANAYPKGTYVCRVRRHVVAVVDGVILDTWDSSYLTVYTAWKIDPPTSIEALCIDKNKEAITLIRILKS